MPDALDFYRGQKIGKYEVLTQLSLGGMAELFLAFTSGPGGFRKYVVLKRILPDAKGDEQMVRMFLDEARITAALAHPNVAQVFELGEDEDGPYLAMEFIAGQDLNQVAAECARRRQPIPIGFSITAARDVLNALHCAHTFTDPTGRAMPIIHRDVAQKNVMVGYDGRVKLLDFGIAHARGKLGRTGVGLVKGTTGYMSPEQVRGEPLDGRSDMFALGVMLHELFSGRRLFAANTELEEMKLILEAPVPRVDQLNPKISGALSQVVDRALARERADRFATAREMARALERAAGNLLFDQEQMAAFMRELFEEKLAETRALFESVPNPTPTPTPIAIESERGRFGTPWYLLLVLVILGGGYGAWRLIPSASQQSPVSAAVVPPRPEQEPEPEVEQPAPSKRASQPARAQGTLTLITRPDATVMRGSDVLGTTPLFKAVLPAGTHLLRLKGPDGRIRVLSTPIKAGQNTALRLDLADLPDAPR